MVTKYFMFLFVLCEDAPQKYDSNTHMQASYMYMYYTIHVHIQLLFVYLRKYMYMWMYNLLTIAACLKWEFNMLLGHQI